MVRDRATRIEAIVGETYDGRNAAQDALRDANLPAYALHLLAEFSEFPDEAHRAITAAACAIGSMPQLASARVGERGIDTLPAAVTHATICAHRGDWSEALKLFEISLERRGEAEPAYSLAVSVHAARYFFYYGSYDYAAQCLDEAAAEATQSLPQWQRLIALLQCEIAARRGQKAQAQFFIDQPFETSAHLRPHEAVARATLAESADDAVVSDRAASSADVADALDRSQPDIAASLLHFAASQNPKHRYPVHCTVYDRTLKVLSNDLAAVPFLYTVASTCCATHRERAATRLQALTTHPGARVSRAFATFSAAFAARRTNRAGDALRHAEEAARLFQELGDELYARKAMNFIVCAPREVVKRDPVSELTKRQAEIVALVRSGLSNKEIAARLHISGHTVEHHLTAIFTKLNLRSRHQLQ